MIVTELLLYVIARVFGSLPMPDVLFDAIDLMGCFLTIRVIGGADFEWPLLCSWGQNV